jgi:hypothetical protein
LYQQNHDGSFSSGGYYHAYVPSFENGIFQYYEWFQTTVNRQVEGLRFLIISLINSIILLQRYDFKDIEIN